MVMGSSTSFLFIGGELIYIQLGGKTKTNVWRTNNFTKLFTSLFTNEEQKKLGFRRIDSFVTRAVFVYDVTGTDCWVRNRSSCGRVVATIERR